MKSDRWKFLNLGSTVSWRSTSIRYTINIMGFLFLHIYENPCYTNWTRVFESKDQELQKHFKWPLWKLIMMINYRLQKIHNIFYIIFQSDREKMEGLPVAPFMDRDKVTKPTAQIGFIKFVLIPMFETVAKVKQYAIARAQSFICTFI